MGNRFLTKPSRRIHATLIILALASTGCVEKTEQRRVIVIDKVSCNIQHANERRENSYGMIDLLAPGNMMRSLGGYKTECEEKGYTYIKNGPDMSEVEAISRKCEEEYSPKDTEELNLILSNGGKVVSSTEFSGAVSVYDYSGNTQPGNDCIGKEYILEGPASLFDNPKGNKTTSASNLVARINQSDLFIVLLLSASIFLIIYFAFIRK